MKRMLFTLLAVGVLGYANPGQAQTSLQQNNEVLFRQLHDIRGLSNDQVNQVRGIFRRSGRIGQGNPKITRHPLTPDQCRARNVAQQLGTNRARNLRICGAKNMVPLYDPRTQRPEDATSCIDAFEFPNIPCTYPVVWAKANEVAEICAAVGERICDAHEWEGACAGALEPPDYRFDLAGGSSQKGAVARMRAAHNAKYGSTQNWSYGPQYRAGICGTGSKKTAGCGGGEFNNCGSNTYPTGSFPDCKSPLGVYDLNGNAAETMNLPLAPNQMASTGSTKLGVTELKGSWFIFDTYRAHPDWCRWRAPFWHETRVLSPASHGNYHLSFRCCKTLQ